MSFQRPQPKSKIYTKSRGKISDHDRFQKENQKLHSEINELESVLQLHQNLQVAEDNSVQAMLRKEIGGTRWQHGGSGKLHGYKSTGDLNDPLGLTPVSSAQRRRKAREQHTTHIQHDHSQGTDIVKPPPNIREHQDDSSSADEFNSNSSKYTDKHNRISIPSSKQPRKARTSQSVTKTKDSLMVAASRCQNDTVQTDLFPTEPMHIEDLKHKVLEKIGANVIKRPQRHSSKAEVKCDGDAIPESHSKPELTSHKHSTHKPKLSGKQDSQRYSNVRSESADCKNNIRSPSKQFLPTKTYTVTDRNDPVEDCLVIENWDKTNPSSHTEDTTRVLASREIQTSDYSSDVEAFPDKPEESELFSGASPNHSASPDHSESAHYYNNHSGYSRDRDSSRNSSQFVLFKSHKCLSDDADDTPVLGIIAPLSSTSTSHLQEKKVHNHSKQDYNLQTKESLKCDHAVEFWLRNIGLRNSDIYVELFALNEIEMNDLKYLTAELLNQMGITAVGPVNKILMAILNLQEASEMPSPSLVSGDSIITVPRVSSEATVSKHSPLLSPRVEDCIPEYTNHLQKTYENMNIKKHEASVSELGELDNPERNFHPRVSSRTESARTRPKSKTASTKRSPSASRLMNDDKAAHKPRMQSRNAVSSARQPDSNSGKKEGKKETLKDKSLTYKLNVPSRPPTEAIQKKAVLGISQAAHKIENKQKHEQDEQNQKLKLMKKRKQKRDEMAAKHQDRKTDKADKETVISPSNPLHIAITTPELMSSPEPEHYLVKIPSASEADDINGVTNDERLRPSTAMPRKLDLVLPTEERSLSARERLKHVDLTLQVFKSQSNIHQKLTLDIVKDLQKQLEEIEHEITRTNADENPESSTNTDIRKAEPVKSTHIDMLQLSCEKIPSSDQLPPKDITTRGSHNMADVKKVDSLKETKSSGSVMTISRSKRALLDEIRKEKDDHRKQIRHLQSELSRLQHKDPVKKSELDAKDIIFNDRDIIGEGAFSQVFRGSYQGAEVAIKRLKVPLLSQDRNYFAAEVSLLRELHHPRIVMLIGVCTSHKLPVMVLEYLSKGNLFAILHDSSREMFDHAEYYQIARDIATGMVYLHNHRPAVLHLDLKSMNVLIGIGNRAKIADFGFSKLKHDADVKAAKSNKSRQIQGSPAWMAPEMVQGGEVTAKADVYSFAIIMWEMLTRKFPYEHCTTFQILEQVRLGKRPVIPTDCPQVLSQFIQKCWESQPTKRPNFKDVLVSLENLSFPPDWRALFQQAGVPNEALENLQSTRNIISLVTSTLESSKLQNIIDNAGQTDQLDSSSSSIEEDIPSEQSDTDNADNSKSGGDSKLTVDQMSDDSLESSNTEHSLALWKIAQVESASEGENMNFNCLPVSDDRNKMKDIQTKESIPCSKDCWSPRMSEVKKDSAMSARKSREAWTVENTEESLNDKTDMHLVENSEGQTSTAYVIPAPPPLPPPIPSITGKTLFKAHSKIPVQPKLKPTSQMLKEKSLSLKKSVVKTKDVKRNAGKPRQAGKSTQDGSFVLEASELQKQRTRLKSTACLHPNQLEDLKSVSKKDLYSIAEILRDAMSERRFALGEVRASLDTQASQSLLELSWSTQDD